MNTHTHSEAYHQDQDAERSCIPEDLVAPIARWRDEHVSAIVGRELSPSQVDRFFRAPNHSREETNFAPPNSHVSNSRVSRSFESVEQIPVLFREQTKLRPDPFTVLQSWEGNVLELGEESILVRLSDVTNPEHDDEEVEISQEEVDDADRDLVAVGAVFYWTIGYLDRPQGRMRTSFIRFRRLPAWSKRDIERANKDAQRFQALFEDGHDNVG